MPLDENRPTGTCGVQRQVPVSGTSVAEPLERFVFFLGGGVATLLHAGFKQPLKAFADLHNTAVHH